MRPSTDRTQARHAAQAPSTKNRFFEKASDSRDERHAVHRLDAANGGIGFSNLLPFGPHAPHGGWPARPRAAPVEASISGNREDEARPR